MVVNVCRSEQLKKQQHAGQIHCVYVARIQTKRTTPASLRICIQYIHLRTVIINPGNNSYNYNLKPSLNFKLHFLTFSTTCLGVSFLFPGLEQIMSVCNVNGV